MPLMNVLLTLILVGVLLWLVNTYLPMDGKIKSILNAVIVILVIFWLLNVFGVLSTMGIVRMG
jgi:cation transporter-like permease